MEAPGMIIASQLALSQRLLSLMREALSGIADAFFLYGCLVFENLHISCFFTVDGTPYELFTRVDNQFFSSDEQIELQCKGIGILSDYFEIFMELRRGQDSPPTELYFTYDMHTEEEVFLFGHKVILNDYVPISRYEAWFVSHGWAPLSEWKSPWTWRLENWLKRDDPFQWSPSIESVLADPPWEEPYISTLGEIGE